MREVLKVLSALISLFIKVNLLVSVRLFNVNYFVCISSVFMREVLKVLSALISLFIIFIIPESTPLNKFN